MRRPDIIHAATCRCDRCRPLAERIADAPIRARAILAIGALIVGLLLPFLTR